MPATHWAERAAEQWRRRHSSVGEAGLLNTNVRKGLVAGMAAAGMRISEIHRRTGISRSKIRQILTPDGAAAGDAPASTRRKGGVTNVFTRLPSPGRAEPVWDDDDQPA